MKTMLDEHRLGNILGLALPVGAIAELGVRDGGTVAAMRMRWPERRVLAFDTFNGLPETEGSLECGTYASEPGTRLLLRHLGVEVYAGVFPATATGTGFALVHLDADLYSSTRAGLDYFLPRTRGYIVLDDFARAETPGVARALAEVVPDWAAHIWQWQGWLNQIILRV